MRRRASPHRQSSRPNRKRVADTSADNPGSRRNRSRYDYICVRSSAPLNHPQITDAGTVILRVTIENNTINTGIAVGGVPGIDTQRMQSEVLVPDGGTTVMGGVLADTEGNTQQRTPGLASIPLVGNLFKRKLTTRSSSEILFFITPRIYRPDYQGRPIKGTPTNVNRSTTISQPVPLGNPSSNTPTPTQLQQQQQQQQQQPTQPAPQTLNPAPGVPGATGPSARPGALGGSRP